MPSSKNKGCELVLRGVKEVIYYNRISHFDKIIILCFLIGSSLFSYSIAEMKLSEFFYILDILFIVLYVVIFKKKLIINVLESIIFFLLLLWIFVSTLIQSNLNMNFSIVEMSKTLLHLLFYIVVYFFIEMYLNGFDRCKFNYFNKVFFDILFIISLISTYVYIGILSEGLLPYKFLWAGINTPIDNYLFYGQVPRSRGIFSEPAALGCYLSMGLAYILFKTEYRNLKYYKFKLSVIIINILMTLSLSSYALLLSILLLNWKPSFGISKNKIKSYVIILLMGILFLICFRDYIQVTIFDRIVNIINLRDSSAYNRIFVSFSYINSFWGHGIGNEPSNVWNVYAYIITTIGWVGLFIYILLILVLFRNNYKLGLIFFIMGFTTGGFIKPEFWFYLVLYTYSMKGESLESGGYINNYSQL